MGYAFSYEGYACKGGKGDLLTHNFRNPKILITYKAKIGGPRAYWYLNAAQNLHVNVCLHQEIGLRLHLCDLNGQDPKQCACKQISRHAIWYALNPISKTLMCWATF